MRAQSRRIIAVLSVVRRGRTRQARTTSTAISSARISPYPHFYLRFLINAATFSGSRRQKMKSASTVSSMNVNIGYSLLSLRNVTTHKEGIFRRCGL
jgi:hypothetical protein